MTVSNPDNSSLVELINRAPEFKEELPAIITFVKRSPGQELFEYPLPEIIDVEGDLFEVRASYYDESFISFQGNVFYLDVRE